MSAGAGRWVITFNGEIYNYRSLRKTLEDAGVRFRSDTDTEVVLHGFIQWGPSLLARLRGMFAFAVWDDLHRQLFVARDRLGIKPLYWAHARDGFCFASEITAILSTGLVEPKIDIAGLQSYLRLLWIPDPLTLFSGITKLPPGHCLAWDGSNTVIQKYWEVPPAGDKAVPVEQVQEEVRELLSSAVKGQLQSDVPVGAFLSGGIDSTSIVALAKDVAGTLRTYSIAFKAEDRREEGALDDAAFARLAAAKIGTDHKEITISPDVSSLLPLVVRHLEDPVADPAAINSYLICMAARETSTVLLSGAGADELFGGYRKYGATLLGERYRATPRWLRERLVEPFARALPVRLGGTGLRPIRFAKKFLEHAGLSAMDRFLGFSSYYNSSELELLLGGTSNGHESYTGLEPLVSAWESRGAGDLIDKMTFVDLKYYLPGLGLAYVDKTSMAASVEVRVPLIDDDIVEYVAALPAEYKVQGMATKIILRKAVRGLIPDSVLTRPKAPFSAPIRSWLRGQLAPLVDDYLGPSRILERGLFSPEIVRGIITRHQSGIEDNSLRIWAMLTLEVWIQQFIENRNIYDSGESTTNPIVAVTAEVQ